MNKKRTILLLLLLAALFWFVLNRDPFDRSFEFDGAEFDLARKVANKASANYFYTPKGDDYEQADEFIQLITFDEAVSEDERSILWNTLQTQYGLNALEGSDGTHGSIRRRGVDIVATGTEITLDDAAAYLVYIYRKDQNHSPEIAAGEARSLINQLQNLSVLLDD